MLLFYTILIKNPTLMEDHWYLEEILVISQIIKNLTAAIKNMARSKIKDLSK
jgi:hypothetical protein